MSLSCLQCYRPNKLIQWLFSTDTILNKSYFGNNITQLPNETTSLIHRPIHIFPDFIFWRHYQLCKEFLPVLHDLVLYKRVYNRILTKNHVILLNIKNKKYCIQHSIIHLQLYEKVHRYSIIA